MDNITHDRYCRKAEVRAQFGFSDAQLHRLIAAGTFPAPTYFGPRSPRWKQSTLNEFDRRAQSGELAVAAGASALTQAARTAYADRAATGEITSKRRATAAAKIAAGVREQVAA